MPNRKRNDWHNQNHKKLRFRFPNNKIWHLNFIFKHSQHNIGYSELNRTYKYFWIAIQKMYIQECEDNGYVLVNEILSIHSKELAFFRRMLRLFGFWNPPDACFIERIIYPFLINMLLLCILGFEVYSITINCLEYRSNFRAILILEISSTISRYTWAWTIHTLAVKYFKGRNLEQKLFDIEINDKLRGEFKNMIRNLNWMVAASIFHGMLCFALSILASEKLSYPSRWATDESKLHGKNASHTTHGISANFYKAITLVISISDLYLVPILLSITWLMYLLAKTSRIRLLQLKHEYMSWHQQAEQAIFHHYTFYTKHVQSNCDALRLLFVSHSILMIIMTPQQFYIWVAVSKTKGALDHAIFLYFFAILLIFWITPLYLAESLRKEEDNFKNEVNNFCPQYLDLHCTANESDGEFYAPRTFQSRAEVEKLLSYLEDRQSGFLIGFYSFQFQLSMLSFYIGLLILIWKIMSG